jgi:hypothetical protein
MITDIKKFNKDMLKSIGSPIVVEGGKVFVNRLVHLFGLRSKVELSEFIGVSTGAIATWQTRNTMPYELVIRLHLATGISVEYLLFDELKGDLNVMQYLPDPTLQPDYANIKFNISKFRYSLTKPAYYDGGAVLIQRLVTLFQLASKVDLADLCGINVGTLSTWHTRKTTPHELLCRIHLATGVSMHYLCFGKEWEDVVAERVKADESPFTDFIDLPPSKEEQAKYSINHIKPKSNTAPSNNDNMTIQLPAFDIRSGNKKAIEPYYFSHNILSALDLSGQRIEIMLIDATAYFVNIEAMAVTKGLYLFSINDAYQIGELKRLPDGKEYLIEDNERFPIDTQVTKIVGKVVSVLKKT